MNKLYPVLGLLIFMCFSQPAAAQRTVHITGDTCLESVLTAHITGVPLLLKWYKNDTIVALARAKWNPESVIAAGGNGEGSAANQLSTPQAIVIDKAFNLYIVDNLRIQKWAKNADTGITVAGGNGKGSNTNQFYAAAGVCVDDSQNVYVSDYLTNRVAKWAPGATNGIIVAGGNGFGSGANQLAGAGTICMDKQGYLYIADRWNDRVQKWKPGATAGVTVAGGNGRGHAANQLSEPYAIALDTSGNLYIADSYNSRVQKWTPGAITGITVAGGKGSGSNAEQLAVPAAINVDTAGNIYVADNGNYRLQMFTPGANFGITIAGGHGYGRANNKLSTCYGIAVDRSGNVYASEIGGNKVKKFSPGKHIDSLFSPEAAAYYQAAASYNDGGIARSNVYRVVTTPDQPAGIKGNENVKANQAGIVYSVRDALPDVVYNWEVPPGADISEGQGTATITVNFGSASGRIAVFASNICNTSIKSAKKYVGVNTAGLQSRGVTDATAELKIYPNPASKDVHIVFSAVTSEKYSVELTDASGKVLLKKMHTSVPGTNTLSFDISNYSKGTYFIRLGNMTRGIQIFKLNKQ